MQIVLYTRMYNLIFTTLAHVLKSVLTSLVKLKMTYQMSELEVSNDPFDNSDCLIDHPVEAVVGITAR